MSSNSTSEPTIFVIFGGTGDLNARKIMPALYNLFLDGWMPKQFSIIGTGRTPLTDDQFRNNMHDDIDQFSRSGKADAKKWETFSANVYYQASDVKDSAS
jgi:glucose-6-phosphate 1-dehydrogenase